MENVRHSQAFLRKRKMLTVLPLLVIPFLTLLFWALGGGAAKANDEVKKDVGLNLRLPDAALKDEGAMDKLSFYDLAQKDSAQREERLAADPWYKNNDTTTKTRAGRDDIAFQTAGRYGQPSLATGLKTTPFSTSPEKTEDQIMQKLATLQKQLNKPADAYKAPKEQIKLSGDDFSSGVDQLGQLMQAMNSSADTDPEMKQLETTLDKVLDVQHPERVRDRLQEQSRKSRTNALPVTTKAFKPSVGLLDTSERKQETRSLFYGLEKEDEEGERNTVEAVVHQTQTLVNGAVIKLRLLNDIFVRGILIQNGAFMFGTVGLNGERLEVKIKSIRYRGNLLPVELEVFDLDGLAGIYIPGAITREVAQNSVDNAAQLLEISSLDPSVKAQATNAGLSAVKSLLSKKAKLVKVTVKDGYKILLKDIHENSSF